MKTVTTSVGFQDALGNLILGGNLVLTLSQAAEVTSGGGLIAPKVVVLPLNATTAKIASTQIWFNDELTPTGTTYHAELLDSGGNVIADFGQWSITGASADLSTMVPVTSATISLPGVVLLNPSTATQAISNNITIGGTLGVTGVTTLGTLNSKTIGGVLYADQFTGADMGAKINAALAALPAGGGTIYVPAGTYTVTTGISISNIQDVLLLGAGKGATVLVSGITGNPANPLLSITNTSATVPTQNITIQGMTLVGSSGTPATNTGNTVFINAAAPGNVPVNNVVFRDCYIGRTKGNGINQAAGSIPAAAVYLANNNDIGFDNCTINSSKYGIYMDNVGAISAVIGVWVRNCIIQGHDNDAMFGTAGAQANISVMQSDVSENTGWGLNTTSTIQALHWFSNYSEFNQAGMINIAEVDGGIIQGSRFVLGGTANATALTATEFIKSATSFTGKIIGNSFAQTVAPGTPTAFIRAVFSGEIGGNHFNLAAGTLTNAIDITAGSTGVRINPNQQSGAGTITNFVNDHVTTTVTTDTLSPLLINKSWTVIGGGHGLHQIATNSDVNIWTNGSGAVVLNVVNGGGTGGTTFGDGAGNTTAIMASTGKLTKYGNITTAGNGVASVYGSTTQKTESAADTNVLTFTPPAAVGSYRVRFTMAVSAQNTATLGWTATWKDANGSAQAPTNLALFTTGVAAPALTVTAATNGNYHGQLDIDTDNSATAIVVKLTFTGTSFTAKVSATVERLI